MSAVRELVARLGFTVDTAGFKQAAQQVETVRNQLRGLSGDAERAGRQTALTGRQMAAQNRQRGADGRFLSNAPRQRAGWMTRLKRGITAARAGFGQTEDANGRLRDDRGRFIGGKSKEEKAEAAAAAKKATQGEGALAKLGQLAATAGLTHVLHEIVELGSRAEETANVLGAVFGKERAAEIQSWADKTATEVGRSKYALAEMAGQLGAVATPMLGNQQRAMEMSEAFAKLAVDMGSFYNSTDEDALAALRSAMTGEVESIKRYGVVMNDATMQEYARTQGIKKKISAMTIAEKTELRYGYIMKTTAAAQGDAARTSDGYANSIKAVKAMLMDFGTDMGRAVLPAIEGFLVTCRDAIRVFKDMTDGTNTLQAAMYVLSGIAGVLAADLLLPFVVPAAAAAALVILVDDLMSMFKGGRSIVGDWLDATYGIGTTDELVTALRANLKGLNEDDMPGMAESWEILEGAIDDVGFAIQRAMDKLMEFVTAPKRWMNSFNDGFVNMLKKIPGYKESKAIKPVEGSGDYDYEYARAKGRGVDAAVYETIGEEIEANRAARDHGIMERSQQRKIERKRREATKALDIEQKRAEDALKASDLDDAKKRELNDYLAQLDQQRARLEGEGSTAGMSVNAPAADPNAIRFGRARAPQAAPKPAAAAAYESWTLGQSIDPSLFPQQSVSAPGGSVSSSTGAVNSHNTVTTHNTWHVSADSDVVRKIGAYLDAQNKKTAAALGR